MEHKNQRVFKDYILAIMEAQKECKNPSDYFVLLLDAIALSSFYKRQRAYRILGYSSYRFNQFIKRQDLNIAWVRLQDARRIAMAAIQEVYR